jgi:hypothetical protein
MTARGTGLRLMVRKLGRQHVRSCGCCQCSHLHCRPGCAAVIRQHPPATAPTARLDRLNAQLQEFYGPLYAIFQAEHIAHLKFVDTLRPGSSTLFAPDVPPLNDDELALWRLWAQSTHQHRSSRAYEVIISKAHLLIEDEMPQCLLAFCAHKAGYDVLIERWKQQDYSEHLSVVRHPGDELRDYLRESFTRLKREQARELEATQGRTGKRAATTWLRQRAK